jgi:hypothetical protein
MTARPVPLMSRLKWPATLLWLAGWLCVVAGLGTARAATFSTVVTNGPATNRVNLVFFSEGYTSNQFGQFLTDVTNASKIFFSVEPYQEYANYFNVFAVFTNSAQSGSTHLNENSLVPGKTAFNSTYDASDDTLITIPPNANDSNASDGLGKISALLRQFVPATNNDFPILMVNDPTEGGSDNLNVSGSTVIVSPAIFSVGNQNLIVHESGHALGGLGDEYTTPYPGFPAVEQPNTTTNTNPLTIKWNAWIPANTPIPTPFAQEYYYTVGLFEGAHYSTTNWYRPFNGCVMQGFSGNQPGSFCPVCTEALVLGIYGKARPIDSRSPANNALTVTSAQLLTFNVGLLAPVTHDLEVQWFTNGTVVASATNPVFTLWPRQLGNGTQKVQAEVFDPTDLVRTDAKNLLDQTNVWTLTQTLPAIQDQITAPTAGLVVSNPVYTVRGTAGDGAGIGGVWWQLNHGGWNLAVTTNNWTNWSVTVTLSPGTNVLQSYAADTRGYLSTTSSVAIVDVLDAPLAVNTYGLGSLNPNDNGIELQIGRNYAITATPASGFSFTNWTISTNWIGGVITNQPTVQFTMATNLTLLARFVDVQKPVAAITNLTAGQRVANAVYTIKGTASDNWQVANVSLRLNGGGWTNVNGTTNWSMSVGLSPGTNSAQVRAADLAGNLSTTNSVNFDYVVTNQLSLKTIGLGTISPNDSNVWLEVGRNYSLTAAPASNFSFTNWLLATNWLGGVTTNRPTVQFMMAPNLTLAATFAEVTKPVLAITNLLAGQLLSNVVIVIKGMASDNWQVANVWCQLNTNAWNPATTTNNYKNWSVTNLNLVPGTNLIKAYAVNLGGNFSNTNSLAVVATNLVAFQLTEANIIVTNARMGQGGLRFNLQVTGIVNGVIQVSTDLVNWETVTNFTGTNTTIQYLDSTATNLSQRFYRAVLP